MKELSIEEKAKRYDEAKINGSRLWECGEITRGNYEYIFPELKESEDEKVIRDIEVVLESSATKFFKEEGKMPIWYDRAVAWLKKQDKKIDAIENFDTEDYLIYTIEKVRMYDRATEAENTF